MKKIFIILLLLVSARGFSQKNGIIWYDPISIADKTYGNLHPRIILDQYHNPLVLWGDDNGKAFLAKWTGNGFADPVQVNPPGQPVFTSSWAGPEIASRGDTIYIVYKKLPEDHNHIFIKHSYDGGKTFSYEAEVDDNRPYITRFPTVAMDPYGNPIVSYMRLDDGFTNPRYVVVKSGDLGETFANDTTVANFSGDKVSDCCAATVIESGNATVLLYRDNLGGLRNIWAGISRNAGISFPRGIQVDSSQWATKNCPANPPHGIIIGDTLYTVYMSVPAEKPLVFLSKATLSGLLVSPPTPVTGLFPGLTGQNFPRMANEGNATAMIWEQSVGSDNQICLSFTNDVVTGFPASYDTVASGGVFSSIDAAIGGGHLYIVWQDDYTGKLMCRVGHYEQTVTNQMLSENTTIALIPSANGKYFTVSLPGISSCMMVDLQGKEYEMDIKPSRTSCKVNTEDLDPGVYIVRIIGKDDKVYNYKYTVKEIIEKEKPEHRRR